MSDNTKIVVDLGQMRVLRETMGKDVDVDLAPGLATATGQMQRTGSPVRMACEISIEDKLAEATLNEALRVHKINGEAHLKRAEQLGNVLALILENYRSADDVSRMDNATIEWLIYSALPKPVPRGLL